MAGESISRRAMLVSGITVGTAMVLGKHAFAEGLRGDELPLVTTGLEHIGMVVPDVEAATRFYSTVFNPDLQKEKDAPLRYYVMLGSGYIAIGSRPGVTVPKIDHYCTLVRGYNRELMTQALTEKGLSSATRGVVPDPDGIGLQLIATPGGPGPTAVPGGRLVEVEPLVRPTGMDNIVLKVADLHRSAEFYSHFFPKGRPAARNQLVFEAADTRIILQASAPGEVPGVAGYSVRVAKFDHAKVSSALAALGAVVDSKSAARALRFRDPNGLAVELKTTAGSNS
jgi:catechol 2,3-dioxygenase-like lactoylglutathione lyase family enzyme